MEFGHVTESLLREPSAFSRGPQILSKLLSGFHPDHADLAQTKSLQTKALFLYIVGRQRRQKTSASNQRVCCQKGGNVEDLGSGKLTKFAGIALVVIGLVLAAIGTSNMGQLVFYGVIVLAGAALIKLGEKIAENEGAGK